MVLVDDSLLNCAELVRRERVCPNCPAPRDHVVPVDPPEAVEVNDWQPERGAELAGKRRLSRTDTAEDRDSLWSHLKSLVRSSSFHE